MTRLKKQKADYGQEMSGVIRVLLIGGTAVIIAGLALPFLAADMNPAFRISFVASGAVGLIIAAIGIWSSRVGKPMLRDQVMKAIQWKGNETVLDVGCGQGLLLVGAAMRLISGKSYGIDSFISTTEYKFSREKALENAAIEGVKDRVDVQVADAQKLPFPDRSFDVVMSSLVLHHVQDFSKALREMARVLRPGGIIVIADLSGMIMKSARVFDDLGMVVVANKGIVPLFLFPVRMLSVRAVR